MFTIDKVFEFCYGHRVYSQTLNSDFTENHDTKCKCRHDHGHQGTIHVFIESNNTDYRGMVVDFKELGWFKTFVDTVLDHRFIIDYNDPMFDYKVVSLYAKAIGLEYNNTSKQFFLENCLVAQTVPGLEDRVVGYNIDMSNVPPGPMFEVLEGYFIVDFVPTSENLSKWVYDVVQSKMSLIGAKVQKVTWNETPKSRAEYRPGTIPQTVIINGE